MKQTFLTKLFKIIPFLRRKFYIRYNRFHFKAIGVIYGKNLSVYNKVYVHGCGVVCIGDNLRFRSGNGINPISKNICGEIMSQYKDSVIEIGDNVGISSACIWCAKKISIGNNVNIGGDCLIIDTDAHPHNYLQRRYEYRRKTGEREYAKLIPSAPIKICDDVWIGARCQILKGVTIGERSIIAAGSVVVKDIPSNVVAGGNPCKIIKKIIE